MTRRLLILGLDGLDPELLRRLLDEIPLPSLERLLGASSARMAAGEERYTGLAWEQFSTGLDVAAGGRSTAVAYDPATYGVAQPVTRLAPFTATLDARVVAFDVPYLDLDQGAAHGMARWGAHDPGVPRHARPRGLEAEIEARFGSYPAEPWIYGFVWPDETATRRMGAHLVRAVQVRTELTTWLLTRRLPRWDLALTVIAELHSASEALWHGVDEEHPLHDVPSAGAAREALVAVYTAVDRCVERIVDACPDTEVLAFTPHGMGRNAADVAAMILLPELLYRWGRGREAFRAPRAWMPGLGPPVWPTGADWSRVVLDTIERPRGRWRRSLRTPPAHPGFPLDWMPTTHYRPAWPALRAFALPSFYDSRVRFNIRGREPRGCVAPGEERALVEQFRGLLAETRDLETGAPVKVRLLSPHDGTIPTRVAGDADLVVRWGRPTTGFEHPRLGRIGPAPWRRPGGHTGGDGRIAALGGIEAAPSDLGSPATLAAFLGHQFGARPAVP